MAIPATEIPEWGIDYAGVEEGREARRDATLVADVVIVGSGAGGAVTASRLAEAGLDVLVLEEGPFARTQDFDTDVTKQIQRLYRDAGTSMILGKPGIIFAEGRCVGGSTVINGGMTWRTPERILESWQREHGIPAIDAAAMAPWFDEVEAEVHPETQAPDTFERHHRLFEAAATRLGWNPKPTRRNMRRCAGLNNCAFGCPTGAKQSMLVTYLPRALRAGARVMADARVDRILFEGSRAVGVRGRFLGANGRPTYRFSAHAPMIVSSAGARHTPGLLLRSRVRHHGVGRYLTTHPNAKSVGIFEERLDAWKGAHQNHQVHDFLDEGLLLGYAMLPPGLLAGAVPGLAEKNAEIMALYNHLFPAACLIEDATTGRVRLGLDGQPVLSYSLCKQDIRTLHRGVAKSAEIFFEAGAKRVLLPFPDLQEISSVDEIRRILDRPLDARGVELMTVHIMSSARMSGDPRRGATDAFGRVNGIDGLYVADASLFPGPVGVNPMDTILALCARNAAEWVDRDLGLRGLRAHRRSIERGTP